MNSVTYTIVPRKDAINKRGEMPVYLQVFVNKERDYIPLSIHIQPAYWNQNKEECTYRHPDADLNNEIIDLARSKAKEILRDANKSGVTLTKKIFREKFYLMFGNNFTDYFINQVELRYQDGQLSPDTHKTHRSQAMKFKRFRHTTSISDISRSTIESYEAYLIKIGNGVNTRRTSLKVLHTYILRAMENAKIAMEDPFNAYHIPPEVDTRESLKPEELTALLEVYDKREFPEHLHISAMYFLLSSFTGMRLMDVKKFGYKMIAQGKLIYTPNKTKKHEKIVRLEMSNVARRIILDVLHYMDGGGKMKSDQNINDDLKKIATQVTINPKLHFHMARHTFATTFIRMGGSVEVLQRILCHSKIETTMKYVGMIDDRIDREMKLFDLNYK
jgi:site-specific recombinase XerD